MKVVTIGYIIVLTTFIVLLDYGLHMPFYELALNLPGGDKVGHLILMGTLSFLVNMTLSAHRTKIFNHSILSGSSIVAFVVTLEEISQLFVKGRTFSLYDLLFDYVGIVVFGWFSYFLLSKKPIGQSSR